MPSTFQPGNSLWPLIDPVLYPKQVINSIIMPGHSVVQHCSQGWGRTILCVLPLVDPDHVAYSIQLWITKRHALCFADWPQSKGWLEIKSAHQRVPQRAKRCERAHTLCTDSESGCGRQCETPTAFIGGCSYICGGKMLSRTSRTTLMSGLL